MPTINLGNRQKNRVYSKTIVNSSFNENEILKRIKSIKKIKKLKKLNFGKGNSARKFYNIIKKKNFWNKEKQKHFKL